MSLFVDEFRHVCNFRAVHVRRICRGLVAVALVLLVSCSLSTSAREPMTDTIDVLMRQYDGPVPGASVLVRKNGETVFIKGYGLADLERGVAVTTDTRFRLASVTKQFTATAIEILEERGELSYEDRVSRYLPTLSPQLEAITIRHLLTHSSGLIDYEDLIPDDATTQIHDRDVLALLESTDRLYFDPGESYRYSNSGYALLALIVEKVSGQSFSKFLEKEIFIPLSMGSVAHVEGVTQVEKRAYGHAIDGDSWIRRDQSITSAVLWDGGVYASVEDLAKWDAALEDARLVSRETLRIAETPHVSTDQTGVSYGFGWRISEHRGHRQIWHSGETSGFRNVLIRFPDQRLTVIVLTNRSDPRPYDTAMKIADLFLD